MRRFVKMLVLGGVVLLVSGLPVAVLSLHQLVEAQVIAERGRGDDFPKDQRPTCLEMLTAHSRYSGFDPSEDFSQYIQEAFHTHCVIATYEDCNDLPLNNCPDLRRGETPQRMMGWGMGTGGYFYDTGYGYWLIRICVNKFVYPSLTDETKAAIRCLACSEAVKDTEFVVR